MRAVPRRSQQMKQPDDWRQQLCHVDRWLSEDDDNVDDDDVDDDDDDKDDDKDDDNNDDNDVDDDDDDKDDDRRPHPPVAKYRMPPPMGFH